LIFNVAGAPIAARTLNFVEGSFCISCIFYPAIEGLSHARKNQILKRALRFWILAKSNVKFENVHVASAGGPQDCRGGSAMRKPAGSVAIHYPPRD